MQMRFSRRNLIAPARLRSLMQRSDVRGAVQLGSHLLALGVSGSALWVLWGTLWAVPVFMVHGVLLNFLYAGQHELSHGTVFRTKWPNMVFGRLFGFLLLYPRDFDWIQHSAHHQWTQNWEKDGELVREPYTLGSYLLWMSGITYWHSRVARLLRFSRGIVLEPYVRPEQHALVIREARWHMAGYAAVLVVSVAAQNWAAVILWLAPMLVMKPVHQLQNTIEHLGLSHEDDIFRNTRSTRTNAAMRWLCWQMPYHTAHHAFPSVPFWRLRDLDAELKGNGAEPYAMGWIEFQVEVIRKLAAGPEDSYPYDEVWVVSTPGGARRVEAA
ncbi:fatty acid desaturase [Pseudoruegeria sp. HB172150]|uniref:fatty acid desaturase n=1 Tax=Pseudoruegeria sp. HB172150 TaxID=2721164 RepID=UPI0015518BC2|nr:fatty acid desaturase [Pseudoruegeria sp. HB172150]